jgi:hypothetical protein
MNNNMTGYLIKNRGYPIKVHSNLDYLIKNSQKDNFRLEKNLILNTYLPANEFYIINYLKTLDTDNYLLCLQYLNNDVQIGITGTVNYKETYINAINREFIEETGKKNIIPKFTEIDKFTIKYCKFINTTVLYTCSDKSVNINTRLDIKTNCKKSHDKVLLLMHGPLDYINNYISTLDNNEDKITGHVAIKISDVIKALEIISQHSIYKWK